MLGTTSINIRAASLNFSYLRCSHLYILDKPQGLKDEDKRGHWNHAWAQPIRPWPGLDTVPRMGLVPREVTPRVLVCDLVDAASAQWANNIGWSFGNNNLQKVHQSKHFKPHQNAGILPEK